ncbi:MAG: undecaprenyl-diphosphate phosphatase [Pseudomonadota bacterium]
MDWLQVVILALVQGLTEFLPISSSAHLVLPAQILGWPDQGLAFDVGVHFGTLLAVLIYFRDELQQMLAATLQWPRDRVYSNELDWVLKLAAATLPVVVVGFLAKDFVEAQFRSVTVIATTTILFGIALYFADRRPQANTVAAGTLAEDGVSWRQAWLIGLAQVMALVPGTSRSGVTITAALFLGMSRTSAARFSFLLAIPTIAGAQLLLSVDLIENPPADTLLPLLSATLIAGLSAYTCIHFFIRLVERTGMLPYVIYRLLLGAGLILFTWLG